MAWRSNGNASTLEKVVSALCYLTGGIAGIIYIILSRESYQSNFFRFHFLQSIILAILLMLFGWANGFASMLALGFFKLLDGLIPGIGGNIANIIFQTLGIVLTAFGLLPIYGLIMAALGKYADIPFISNVVRQQMR